MSQPMILSGQLWHENGFRPGRLYIQDGVISRVEYGQFERLPDEQAFGSALITPGLLDLQLNGGIGLDFTFEPTNSVNQVAEALPRWGVTGFLPTYITATLETYATALKFLADRTDSQGAQVLGAHIEGPYLNPKNRGAHDANLLRQPDLAEVKELLASGLIRLMTLAPELPGALEVIRYLYEHGVLVAAGHSAATYEEGKAAFAAGVRCLTHLFNAMPPLHHRNPGLVGAALETPGITVNLIVDGGHLHPTIVKLIYQLKGPEGILLVTDAMAGLGMPPGRYNLAGQAVIVDENSARLADSPQTLAGSILTLNAAIRNMIEFTGCPPHEAVGMATLNAARLMGLEFRKGRLAAGYDADLAVFTPDFEPLQTIIGGQVAFEKAALSTSIV